jgi:hypothetical protein
MPAIRCYTKEFFTKGLKKIFFISFLVFTTSIILKAQQRYNVSIKGLDALEQKKLGLDKIKTYDSLQIKKACTALINDFRTNGYIFANVDKMDYNTSECSLEFFKGEKYQVQLNSPNAEVKYLFDIAGLSNQINKLDSANLNYRVNKLLNYLNNNGYPFAKVIFDKYNIEENRVKADLQINKGLFTTFDSLSLPTSFELNRTYLYKYLGIQKGKPYDHSLITSAGRKLKELPFVKADTLPTVSFYGDKAVVNLPIKNQGASSFDFILGFLPKVDALKRSWTINGELSADLYNKLGQGEIITFKGRQYSSTDRQININVTYPYLLKSAFGLDAQFDLFQNRNISTDANGVIGLQYQFTGNNQLRISWQSKTSRLTNIDLISIGAIGRLPQNLDYNFNAVSLGFKYSNLDYKFNPAKGINVDISANIGLRKIVQNFQISEIKSIRNDFSKAYDTLRGAKFQSSFNLGLHYYIPVSSWSTIRLSNNSGIRITEGLILENETYRIGGNRLMRGFDELSILTDSYSILTSEFRIILEKNSYLTLPFVEYSKLNEIKQGVKNGRTGLSIGAGLNFSTQAGIFNFVIAAGNNLNGGPNFGQAKIHFGYVNLF